MMTERMKQSLFYILAGITAVVLCVTICSAAFAPVFEPMPLSMKNSSDAKPYEDESFLKDAGEVIGKISNSSVPTGSKLSEVTDAYYRLIMDNVSPELFPKADNIVAYIYYTSQAGSAYTDFNDYKKSVSKSTDGSEYYTVADQYYKKSGEYWDKIKDLYPNQSMYTLPAASDEMPSEEELSNQGNTLKGLDTALPMTQKEYDPNSEDQTEKFKTTVIRWFEDYVDRANEPEDLNPLTNKSEGSPGNRFLTGEGVGWADSTYQDLTSLNVAEDFMDKANYADAFFYLISQARDQYQQYIDDRKSVSSVTRGEKSYDSAKKYYTEAQKSIGYFSDIIPNETNTTLPEFPKFDEVDRLNWDYGEIGVITEEMANRLGYNEDDET
ncbi:MAG: hypothetical protein LUQ07_05810 [Methanospirillum sp.]|nr:hypothetical protein [Methanospirillum sp.]